MCEGVRSMSPPLPFFSRSLSLCGDVDFRNLFLQQFLLCQNRHQTETQSKDASYVSWVVSDSIVAALVVVLQSTVFENHRKSLIQHCERSQLHLHFEWTKVNQNCQKWPNLASFWKLEACGQTVLPDRSVLIGQKLVENAKIQKIWMRHFE